MNDYLGSVAIQPQALYARLTESGLPMSISKTKLPPPENFSPKHSSLGAQRSSPEPEQNGAPDSEKRSVPPPPPSARPVDQRPTAVIPSPLPPPISARVPLPAPTLPKAHVFAATPIAPQIRQLEEETSSLRKRLAAQRSETRTEQKNNELLRNELALLRTQVGRNEASAVARTELQSLRDEHQTSLDELKATHRAAQAKLQEEHGAALRDVRQKAEKEIEQLRAQLDQSENHDRHKESARIKELNLELESLQRQNTALEHKITAAEQRSAALQAIVDTLKQQLVEATAGLMSSAPSAPTSSATASVSKQPDAPAQSASVDRQPDELTRIKGVGPAFAKALAAAGVTTFAQIAAWTESDVERLAPLLRTTAARIKKNDWPGAARKLC